MSAVLKPVQTGPRLSVRAAANFMHLRIGEQMKMLHDQKYPRQVPQVFRQPYYGPPLKGIKNYLVEGPAALVNARADFQRLKQSSRRLHCNRVLESFVKSAHAGRSLKPIASPRLYANLRGVELRLSPDLVVTEGGVEKFIYFNFSAREADPNSARLTLEFAHWLLSENGIDVDPSRLEYIDLFTNVLYTGRRPRKSSLRDLEDNVKLIEALWPTLDP